MVPTRAMTTAFQHERLLSLSVLGDDMISRGALDAQRIRTNAARTELERLAPALETGLSPAMWNRLHQLLTMLSRVTELRSGVDARSATPLQTLNGYNAIIAAAFEVYERIRVSSDTELNDQTRAVVMVGRSREMLSQQAALISGAVAAKVMGDEERAKFRELVTGRRLLYSVGFNQFDEEFRGLYRELQDSPAYTSFERIENAIAAEANPETSWMTVAAPLSDSFDKLGGDVSRRITERSMPLAVGILIQIGLAGGLGLVAVAVSIFVSVRFGRRISAELVGLQRAALDLADRRLPEVVERLRRGEDVRSEVPELHHGSTTEIVSVGEAFSSVQRTAVEAAVGQAHMREGLNKVFVSLARRNQSLLHRQLAMLEAMEQRATDPETLEDLFGLDHLTTRMRRHSEGLIILSGSTPGRGWRVPVTVYDVVRAAVEEVEDYLRVAVSVPQGPAVIGTVVTDVIHLIAELVENAAVFSPPHTSVRVNGQLVANGYAIEVEDRGLGIPPDNMVQLNERLTNPPEFDLADSDRLGLFVVTQLAARHNIRVSLRSSPFGGTTAIVLLPSELMAETSMPQFAYSVEVEQVASGGLPRRTRHALPERTRKPAPEPGSRPAPASASNSALTSFREGWHRAEQDSGAP
ncbi:sensor histidine kinase [Streptosporangium subroseum]|uniref:sensor histidine kinase n=1 Tax=Streptosporangium subroseum TaxID=106412 RepID=UPI00308D0A42|nr:sensor histidine kinase [Streptosporangium subroseum]